MTSSDVGEEARLRTSIARSVTTCAVVDHADTIYNVPETEPIA